ncbi:MAG: hypothetical protein ACLVAO_10290 [Clostridium fessum]
MMIKPVDTSTYIPSKSGDMYRKIKVPASIRCKKLWRLGQNTSQTR